MVKAPAMRWTAAVVLAALTSTTIASAQQPPASSPAPAAADSKDEARLRYERGMQLYTDGAYDLALIEINRAYDLAPSYKLLYNVAQINAQLQNYAGALRAFERYLAEGAGDIPAKRQEEVAKEITNLRARTANLTVIVNVEGADVLIDGFPQASPAPGQPLLVNAGVRKVGARKSGYQPSEQVFTLAGGDQVEVKFDLVPVAQAGSASPFPTQPLTPREKEPSYLWVGWVTTGAFAAGAVITGIAALSAAGDRDDELATPAAAGQSAADKKAAIDDAESSRTTLAVMTDIFAGAAIITGGVTLAFTIAGDSSDKASTAPRMQVGLHPTGVDLAGSF